MSSRKAANASPFSGLMKGGRKRKNNLEDLIHQFIISDHSKSTSKPVKAEEPEETGLFDQLNQFKKVKKTPQRNNTQIETEKTETPPKRPSQEPTQKIIDSEEDDNMPMFPAGYLGEDDEDDEPKKRNTRGRKESVSKSKISTQKSNDIHGKTSTKKETPKKASTRGKKSANKASVASKEAEDNMEEEEGMPKDFMFDDNGEEDDGQHEARFQFWLQPENIVDDKGRRPDEDDYNPGTLSIPEEEMNKFQSVQKKYWEWKSKYFDKVVAFNLLRAKNIFPKNRV